MARLLGGQADDEGGGVGQHDPRRNRGPARKGRALQAEETEQAEHPAKEALNTGALAQFGGGPGGRQPVALLLPLGVPRNNGRGAECRVDPGDQLEASVAGIQPDHARAQPIQADGGGEQRAATCLNCSVFNLERRYGIYQQ
jgi:hypothetical protein